ncbi:MAG TPA: cytochrome C oxidase subunit IV family protein [Candidatus Polarisedimenticolia bacterium]|nr:cytochrome C oxidase subunit IV family protein [Candidatus Polarisedimenticolia bacterium]
MSSQAHGHAEPNYWMVWLALAVLTAVELGVSKTAMPKAAIVVSLCALALTKAGLVAAYFMHLRFERHVLMLVVLSPLLLSAILYVGLVPDATTHLHWLP